MPFLYLPGLVAEPDRRRLPARAELVRDDRRIEVQRVHRAARSRRQDHRGRSARRGCARPRPGVVQPRSASPSSISSRSRVSTSRTPASPPTASPQAAARPTSVARAPSASAFSTSAPRRMPPSTYTSQRPATASTTSGSASSVAGAPSSWRPPWFETMIAAAPCSTASRAVLPRDDSLQDHRQPALGGDPLEIAPGDGRAHLELLGERHRDVRVLALDVGERQPRRQLEAEPGVALAAAEHGRVHRQHDRGVAARARLGDVVERALPVAEDVELQPARSVAAGRRDLVVGARRDRRDAEHRPGRRGGARGRRLALGVEQALHREGRDEERHRDRGAEHGRGRGHLADVDEHARPEAPPPEGPAVGAQRDLVAGAALEVAPDAGVDLRRGGLEVVGDVDHEPNLASAFAAICRSPP